MCHHAHQFCCFLPCDKEPVAPLTHHEDVHKDMEPAPLPLASCGEQAIHQRKHMRATPLLGTLQLINRLNLRVCADGKPRSIWLQIVRMPASGSM